MKLNRPVRILLLLLRVYVMIAVPLVAFTFLRSLQPAVVQAAPAPMIERRQSDARVARVERSAPRAKPR